MKRFLIVGTQRTGSSAFAEQLNRHEEVGCGWEWANHVSGRAKVRIAKGVFSGDSSVLNARHAMQLEDMLEAGVSRLGFRMLFRASRYWVLHPRLAPSVWLDGLAPMANWVARHPDIYVIHLVRTDSLAWLKSKYLSRETQTYAGAAYPEKLKVTIPVRSAIRRLQCKQWLDRRIEMLAATNPYKKFTYEEFRDDNSGVVRAAAEFLGCRYMATGDYSGKIYRQSTKSSEDYIANYRQLVESLRSAGMEG